MPASSKSSAPERGAASIPPTGSPELDLLSARILVVDDQPTNVDLLVRMLEGAGYTAIESTTDPRRVCPMHQGQPYDAILLDLHMPGMDGFDVMRELEGVETDDWLPVIVLTARPELKVRALRAGARDFVSKPFDLVEVLTRLSNLIEVRLLHTASRRHGRILEQALTDAAASRAMVRLQGDELKLSYDRVVAESRVSDLIARSMARDLQLAGDIYRALLPARLPECRGYELAAVSRPAEQASGDVYDVIARPDGTLVLLLADATGHGIGPALSASQLRSMVRMAVLLGAPLDRIVAECVRQLAHDLPDDRLVTAFVGELDPIRHSVRYRAPGQGPLLHWHAADGYAEWRTASQPPFGVPASQVDEPDPMDLEPGDVVVLATDGIFERADPSGRWFGEAGVAEVVRRSASGSAQGMAEALRLATDRFAGDQPPTDDAAVLILKRI